MVGVKLDKQRFLANLQRLDEAFLELAEQSVLRDRRVLDARCTSYADKGNLSAESIMNRGSLVLGQNSKRLFTPFGMNLVEAHEPRGLPSLALFVQLSSTFG